MREPLTRAAIAAAARDILVAEGLPGVSLRKVAARLSVTAPALYAHVVDKRDLLQTIAEQELETLLDRFNSIDERDPVARAAEQARAYADWAAANPDVFRALFLYRPELTAESLDDRPSLCERILEHFRATMRDAGDRLDGVDGEDAALTLWSAVHGAVVMQLAGPAIDIERRGRLAESVANTVMTGLARAQNGERLAAYG